MEQEQNAFRNKNGSINVSYSQVYWTKCNWKEVVLDEWKKWKRRTDEYFCSQNRSLQTDDVITCSCYSPALMVFWKNQLWEAPVVRNLKLCTVFITVVFIVDWVWVFLWVPDGAKLSHSLLSEQNIPSRNVCFPLFFQPLSLSFNLQCTQLQIKQMGLGFRLVKGCGSFRQLHWVAEEKENRESLGWHSVLCHVW